MGFYGNLTNTARTQFQFDRIYPNRYSMETNINRDGVYLGRYVLVEYDTAIHEDTIKVAYYSNEQFFTTINLTQHYLLNTYVAVAHNQVTAENVSNFFTEENGLHKPAIGYDSDTVYYKLDSGNVANGVELNEIIQTRNINGDLTGQFWKCVGVNGFGYAQFEEITEFVENNYLINYNIDITYYGQRQPEGAYSRAWDSTVWQKIYAEGEIKYIMIAELNSAAPSFSMSYDAPTQTPLAPHVDASSANNIYRIHIQPTWGFRVKEETDQDYSDIDVLHIESVFDTKTNRINEYRNRVAGAIYWNNDGFNIVRSNHNEYMDNYIKIEPTGRSGLHYNEHRGYVPTDDLTYESGKNYYTYNSDLEEYNQIESESLVDSPIEGEIYEYKILDDYDINEFSFFVPAIGNAVATFYDTLYGKDAANEDLRYRDTKWKYYRNGNLDPPDSSLGGVTKDLTTLAGSINYLHDLEGTIIYLLNEVPLDSDVQSLSSDFIYCIKGSSPSALDKYYYRAQTYHFDTSAVLYQYVKITTEDYIPNCYFTLPKNAALNVNNLAADLNQVGYDNSKDYYKRLLAGEIYKRVGTLEDYAVHTYYYIMGTDYLVDDSSNFVRDRQYYKATNLQRWRTVQRGEELDMFRTYYFDLSGLNLSNNTDLALYRKYGENDYVPLGWFETSDTTFQADKTYYLLSGRFLSIYIEYEVGDDIPNDLHIVEVRSREEGMSVGNIAIPADLDNNVRVTIVTENNLAFKTSYLKDRFYYLDETGTVRPEVGGPTYPIYDYKIDHEYPYTEDREYYVIEPSQVGTNTSFYYPNAYFYFDTDDGVHDPFDRHAQGPTDQNAASNLAHLDSADYPTQGRYYWIIELSAPQWVYNTNTNEWSYIQTILDWHRATDLRSITEQWIVYNPDTTLYELEPATPTYRYYYQGPNEEDVYHMIHQNNRNVVCSNPVNTFYQFDIQSWNDVASYSNEDFYIAQTYYYFNDHDDIILDQNPTLTPGRSYFYYNKINGIIEPMSPVKFYEPEYYYYKVSGNYVLDTNDHTTANRVYYEKDVYRVVSDVLNIYGKGAAWNMKALMVPCSVTLGVAEPWYELREIGDVSTGTNSINNIILQYNKMLANGERLLRSKNSVQGTLNLYRDAMDRIEAELEPNRLITSDYYGRMTTTDYSIKDLLDRIAELEARVQALES